MGSAGWAGWLAGWLAGWMMADCRWLPMAAAGCVAGWRWLAEWLQIAGWLAGWLAGDGWEPMATAGWLAGWLDGYKLLHMAAFIPATHDIAYDVITANASSDNGNTPHLPISHLANICFLFYITG